MAMPATVLQFSKTNDYVYDYINKIYLVEQRDIEITSNDSSLNFPGNCLTFNLRGLQHSDLMEAIPLLVGEFLDQPVKLFYLNTEK